MSPFHHWITQTLPHPAPEGVVAYNFNLSEAGDWIVEIIGASSYDEDDPDWCCPPEQWTSRPEEFEFAQSAALPDWEHAHAHVAAEVLAFLQHDESPAAQSLRAVSAVCVGFVDGDLQRVWPQA